MHESERSAAVPTARREQGILRIGDVQVAIHGGQQLAQVIDPTCADRRKHHEVGLRRHEAGNCSAKLMVLVLSQYTMPRYMPGTDLADLVANMLGYQRGLGVIKHDALFAIEPAVVL